MEIGEFENKLLKNGWFYTKISSTKLWQNGRAILMILDEETDNPIFLTNDEYYRFNEMKRFSFTWQRLMITWENGNQWFLRY